MTRTYILIIFFPSSIIYKYLTIKRVIFDCTRIVLINNNFNNTKSTKNASRETHMH